MISRPHYTDYTKKISDTMKKYYTDTYPKILELFKKKKDNKSN